MKSEKIIPIKRTKSDDNSTKNNYYFKKQSPKVSKSKQNVTNLSQNKESYFEDKEKSTFSK